MLATLSLAWTPTAADDPPVSPETVTADALPTWQINGVAWSQALVGNTVYVTGSFTKARPPGVAVGGAGEVDALNIFAFDTATGALVNDFVPRTDGQVRGFGFAGSTVYVGGNFRAATGALTATAPGAAR